MRTTEVGIESRLPLGVRVKLRWRAAPLGWCRASMTLCCLAVACSSRVTSVQCIEGAEGCYCLPGGTCESGLVCSSNLCARAPSTGGGAVFGPTDADAGTIGSTGADAGMIGSTDAQDANTNENDEGEPTDSSVNDANLADACARLADASCAKMASCFPLGMKLFYGDTDVCDARFRLWCERNLTAPATGDTPDTTERCSDAIQAATCDEYVRGVVACRPSSGSLADGAACAVHSQCQSTNCNLPSNSICGVCGPRVPLGGDCTHGECAFGLLCNSAKLCVNPGELGGLCTDSHPCAGTLVCKQETCAPPSPPGATCDTTFLFDGCDAYNGYYCASSGACQTIQYAQPGEPCSLLLSNLVLCGGGGLCRTASVISTAGTCMPPAHDGEFCDDVNGPQCIWPAACVTNACRPVEPMACR